MTSSEVRVAVIQQPPVLLDREASMAAALGHLATAVAAGARLIVFPEAFLPGYPAWAWGLRPMDDGVAADAIHARLLAASVDLAGPDLDPLREAAAAAGVVVVIGVDERDGEFSRATVYNTVVVIGPDGSILNRHRKMVLTNAERLVWGSGDASGLRAVETPFGRIGVLICWENYMPLARFALYAQGVDIWIAPNWDDGEAWISTMRHIAAEGRCWVIGAGSATHPSDVPASFPGRSAAYPDPDAWLSSGDSVIVAPGGGLVAGPLHREHGILYADIDPAAAAAAHRTLDVAGHYARPELFSLTVDRSPHPQVSFLEVGPGDA
ncbi:MAG: carbon-nitrogen hydrolase family protein [Chloroflexota bacterium]